MAAPPEAAAPAPSRTASRHLVFGGLAGVALAAWAFIVQSAAAMAQMSGAPLLLWLARAMMAPGAAGPYLAASVAMWTCMMLAMMIPAASPAVRLFLALDRGSGRAPAADGLAFAGGYLLVWCGFGIVASLLQWALHRAALIDGAELSVGAARAGWVLLGAGAYQLSPMKLACLRHCQSPLGFLLGHWRNGRGGALRMGAGHGAYCLGCCWALMLLMFAGGVMSVATMAVLSALILAERLLPAGFWSVRLPGLALLAAGVALAAGWY
jgi:predicted metal-binding membrane protein